MNFIKFPVESTNIFPIANTTEGGQLVTEYNLRSRESVYTDESVSYFIGPSFVHAEDDFKVTLSAAPINYFGNSNTVSTSSSVLQIAKGRAVVNGHYIESLVDISIDMVDAASAAHTAGDTELKGSLSIGLKAIYSTEVTLDGSILTENSLNLYEGIQIVILPTDEFKLPKDSPTDQSQVTAHLLLATFSYSNGVISNLVNNYPGKCAMMDGHRVMNLDSLMSDTYPSKAGLDPKTFYTLAGKFYPGEGDGYWSTEWCNSTDAIMSWDPNPHIAISATEIALAKTITTAQFIQGTDKVHLIVPHKQIDGMANDDQLFAPVLLPLPAASYDTGAPGVVTREYTENIQALRDQFTTWYNMKTGKQMDYFDILTDRNMLPSISTALDEEFAYGDYVLVGQDDTLDYTLPDSSRKPSTMYVIIPGKVYTIESNGTELPTGSDKGIELGRIVNNAAPPNTQDASVYSEYWSLDKYRGVPNRDYFVYVYQGQRYYYQVKSTGPKGYSDPILITGGVPLAGLDTVGGFLNAPETAVDGGYVYLDSKGYLRLRDYQLLRSGTLAYQLGEDYTIPNGLTLDAIQQYLDEFVNNRVAFPTETQATSSEANRITVKIEISDDTEGELNIYNLDSRFNTAVRLYITAADGVVPKTTINISDCEKIQLDPSIANLDGVTVNVYRSCIYYNADVFNYIGAMQDISLWYERFSSSDPTLSVEGMTVSQMMYDGTYGEDNIDSISDWSSINVNDYHFYVALQSISFSADGYVNGCGVLVRNASTPNVQYGKNVIHSAFTLPQGPNLKYPASRLKKAVRVSGDFITAYTDSSLDMIVQNTNFSLVTQKYTATEVIDGDIAFLIDSYSIHVGSSINPPEWASTAFHYFDGKIAF